MQTLTELMKHCESEIEKRNQQVKLLFDAYDNYQNHSNTLCSILQAIKTVRDQLSLCRSIVTNTAKR